MSSRAGPTNLLSVTGTACALVLLCGVAIAQDGEPTSGPSSAAIDEGTLTNVDCGHFGGTLPCPEEAECECFCNRHGDPVRLEIDLDIDGLTDEIRRISYSYDEQGNMLSRDRDNDGDGIFDEQSVWTYVYDGLGRVIVEEADFDSNGWISTCHYAYDSNGNLKLERWDYGTDGEIDRTTIYSYDEFGNQIRVEWALDEEEIETVQWRSYEYDEHDNYIAMEQRGGDGTVQFIFTFAYDKDGNRLLATTDRDGDGTIDQRCTYEPPFPPPFDARIRPIYERCTRPSGD